MAEASFPPLPSIEQQFDTLEAYGLQLPEAERAASRLPLPDVYMASDDSEPALYDARVVPFIPTVVAPSEQVCRALAAIRPDTVTAQDARPYIDDQLSREGVILGFSGYGTEGYGYETEAGGIDLVYDAFYQAGLAVDTAVDGGTGYGVPGLSGMIAGFYDVHPVGFVPLRGLRGAVPRETLYVTGEEFGDEAVGIGAMSDVLVVLGGGPNAERELRATLYGGGLAIIAALRQYPANSTVNTIANDPEAQAAFESGQLVIAQTEQDVREAVARIELDRLYESRAVRHEQLTAFLAPRP